MKTLRRFDLREVSYFITVVARDRQELLLDNIDIYWESWDGTSLAAWVILPDHFHAILNVNEKSISEIVHRFKVKYSIRYRYRNGSGKIWQNRFWDHILRNQDDMNRHIDYIDLNPVKHGLVSDPFLYDHSSLHKYHEDGYYQRDWGVKEINIEGEFGE